MSFYQFKKTIQLNCSLDECWEFISNPANLKEITPSYMGFDIISDELPKKMYQGMIIAYRVKPIFSIKTTWVTEITTIKEKEYFVDEQRIGPYKLWHHQHILKENDKGVIMEDIVSYAPPFNFIGKIANSLIIKSKLKEIFDFRENVLNEKFNKNGKTSI